MDETFVFWPRNVMNKITIEDKLFLQNMMGPRTAVLAGTDQHFAASLKKKQSREEAKKRPIREKQRKAESMVAVELHEGLEGTSSDGSESETNEQSSECENETTVNLNKQSHKHCVKTKTAITLPFDILKNERLNQIAIRSNVSPTKLSAIIHDLLAEYGGDP